MPFNLSWCGYNFPLSIYLLARLALAHATHLAFFSVVGSILVMCLVALWFLVAVLTVDGAWRGNLFVVARPSPTDSGGTPAQEPANGSGRGAP